MTGAEWALVLGGATTLLGLLGRGFWGAFQWAFAQERRRCDEDRTEAKEALLAKNAEIGAMAARLAQQEADLRDLRLRLDRCLEGGR